MDFKLQEAIWIISSIRSFCDEGFRPGKWVSKHLNGRAFSLNCRSNRAGWFLKIAIFGARKRLKTLIVPSGEGCSGLKIFSDALAATTAGPERRAKGTVLHRGIEADGSNKPR